jgi:two-component system, OmpR family, response regulator
MLFWYTYRMNTQQQTLLIVDDDIEICKLLSDFLSAQGYRVLIAHDGLQMRRQIKDHSVDLLILDIMLPVEDGLSLCESLRKTTAMPIIFVSANGSEADRVVGLELGADDYLVKPFSPRELLARVKALLRRASGQLHKKTQEGRISLLPTISFSGWRIDRNRRLLLSVENVIVPLSAGEYDLLLVFLEHPNRVLNRNQLLELTRGKEAEPFDRTIDVQVGRLRKKIEKDPKVPTLIKTVRGGGYQFNANVEVV